MRCKYNKQDAQSYYDEHIDDYYKARTEAFIKWFTENAEDMELSQLDVDWYQGLLDSFTFKDESDWLADGYESMLGDCADRAYDEWKERDI